MDEISQAQQSAEGYSPAQSGCCLGAAIAAVAGALAQFLSKIATIASKPSMLAMLASVAEEVAEDVQEDVSNWAGGAFSFLVAGIANQAANKFNEQLWEFIGLHGSALLAAIDVLTNAKYELQVGAGKWLANKIQETAIELSNVLGDLRQKIASLYDAVSAADFPVRYSDFVKLRIDEAKGTLMAINRVAEQELEAPIMRSDRIETIRQLVDTLVDQLCKQPMSSEAFKAFSGLDDVSDLWNRVTQGWARVKQLIDETEELVKNALKLSIQLDYFVALFRQIPIDGTPQPVSSAIKKRGLALLVQAKRELEQDVLSAGEAEGLFKWPAWCAGAIALRELAKLVFPKGDPVTEMDLDLQACVNQLRTTKSRLEQLPPITAEALHGRWNPFRKYVDYAIVTALPNQEVGFFADARDALDIEIVRLQGIANRYADAVSGFVAMNCSDQLFAALDALLAAYKLDRAQDLLRAGKIDEIKKIIENAVTHSGPVITGLGLGLTYAGALASCLETLLPKIQDVELIQKITQIMQDARRLLKSLNFSFPIPNLGITIPIDPKEFLNWKNKVKAKLSLLEGLKEMVSALEAETRSSLYRCD